ncbi:MAG TPA: hypothetical protein GX693_06590 [Firmicutes bacterium]|nr:hypothetical protein [Bacillota bacterium]
MGENSNRREQWEFLTGVAGEPEAGVIESFLRTYEIPVLKKYQEAGGFLKVYMGMTSFGIDLYVPASCLEQAKKLLEEQQIGNKEQE